jgi:phosphoglucomutase
MSVAYDRNTDASIQRVPKLLGLSRPHISPGAYENLVIWLTRPPFMSFREEVASYIVDRRWDELEDAFYTTIPFGTGGRRGRRGPGPNRINERTIAESALGVAEWVLSRSAGKADNASVAIAFDTRHFSAEYAKVTASVFAQAGIVAYLFDGPRATPELSFAVRHLGAQAGIVISASHNPPPDNGFKVYGADGGQVVPPDDAAIMAAVAGVGLGPIPMRDFDDALQAGRIRWIGREVDEAYWQVVAGSAVSGDREVRVVFSPLHGTGTTSVLPALECAGFRDVHVVADQLRPDGDFPTVTGQTPNPEEIQVMTQATSLAMTLDADIALATDPDADRLGCVAKRTSPGGEAAWARLSGNQIGVLIAWHLLRNLQARGGLSPGSLVLRTAVTTAMVDRMAEHFGVGLVHDLLVGFKYVGAVLNAVDDPGRLVFAAEESHGYLSQPHVRDKDAANAAVLLAEAAAQAKAGGSDLWAVLDGLYRQFGYHSQALLSETLPGKSGQERIKTAVRLLRNAPPNSLAGLPVDEAIDRGAPFAISDPLNGQPFTQLSRATDDLLIFRLGPDGPVAGGRAAVRPSGTEPKCKFYVELWTGPLPVSQVEDLAGVKEVVDRMTAAVVGDLTRLALDPGAA